MRTIAPHHPEIYLPLFAWAASRPMKSKANRLKGYRVTSTLDVLPIWCEVRP